MQKTQDSLKGSTQLQSLKVLHVEDDLIDTRHVQRILKKIPAYRIACDHANTITAALNFLREQEYDIVILDMHLSDGFGLDLVKAIKEAAPDKPIVILSGIEDADLTLRAVEYGAQEYLVKNELNTNILMRSIRYAIDRKQKELELTQLSYYDDLTEVPNRYSFKKRLQQAVLRAQRHHKLFALMFIDLDYFKLVNDTFGHQTGDLLLKQVAKRLRNCVRHNDMVARIGGDEFVVLLEGIRNKAAVSQIAQKIIDALSKKFMLNSNEVYVTASIGISLQDGSVSFDVDKVIQYSDKAMYKVKTGGRNGYKYFDESPDSEISE